MILMKLGYNLLVERDRIRMWCSNLDIVLSHKISERREKRDIVVRSRDRAFVAAIIVRELILRNCSNLDNFTWIRRILDAFQEKKD